MKNEPKNKALQLLELQFANDELRGMLPLWLERVSPIAKMRKAKFDALLAEGFTESQAIEIVAKSPVVE